MTERRMSGRRRARRATRDAGAASRVVMFGTYDAAVHPRVAVLRDGLRDAGVEVVECNLPFRLSTAERVRLLQQPWRAFAVIARMLGLWARLSVQARRVGPVDAVIVGYLGHLDVHLARLLFRGVPLAVDHLIFLADTASDRGVGGGWRDRILRAIDAAAIRSADVVLVDTEEHGRFLPERWRDKGLVVPVGAPGAWFQPPTTNLDGPLRVVFYGLFTPLQGTPTIGAAIAATAGRADIHVTMVGSGQDLEETRALAGSVETCTWTPWVTPDDLPALVAAHDVCLGIFGAGDKALRVVPNKVYQGAAAGCAVITSDTEPQRRALAEAAMFVPPENPVALADALVALAEDRQRLASLRDAARTRAASLYRPARVVRPLLDRLDLHVDARH